MKLASPLPVIGLACASSVLVTENRRLFVPPPGLSSRNNHQVRRDLNRRGLSETFSVTSVMPRHAGSTLKAREICASKFLSSTGGWPNLPSSGCPTQAPLAWVGLGYSYSPEDLDRLRQSSDCPIPSRVLCGKGCAREIPNVEPDPQPRHFLLDLVISLAIT